MLVRLKYFERQSEHAVYCCQIYALFADVEQQENWIGTYQDLP